MRRILIDLHHDTSGLMSAESVLVLIVFTVPVWAFVPTCLDWIRLYFDRIARVVSFPVP